MGGNYVRDQLFLVGVALMVLGGMAMFFLLFSWALGGNAFMDTLYGKETVAVLAAGIGIGLLMAFSCRERSGSPTA
jgi:hypothetical protein